MSERVAENSSPVAPRQDDEGGGLDTFGAGPKPLAAVFRPRGRKRRRDKTGTEPVDRSVAQARRRQTDHGRSPTPPPSAGPVEVDELAQSDPVAANANFEQAPLNEPEPSLAGVTPVGMAPARSPAPAEGLAVLPAGADPVWAHRVLLEAIEKQSKAPRPPTDGAWYADLFGRDYLLAYPDRRPFARDPEVDFVEASLGVAAGARVLDLACGYGRVAVPLGRRGYEVIGVDLNLDMLERGLAIVHRDKLPVKLVHGDMRDLKFEQVFDGACLLETSLGFFSEVQDLAVLRGLFRALKPGGRLLLDLVNRDHLLDALPLRNWWEGDGCLLQEDVEFDATTSRLKIRRYLVFGDGRERVHDIDLRLYGLHELVSMLELVGFELDEVSGSIHTRGAFFGARSPRMLIRAARPVG